jgi:hypothetical protein
MKSKIYVILKANEEPVGDFEHGLCYRFKYTKSGKFFVSIDGIWTTPPPHIFDFITLKK